MSEIVNLRIARKRARRQQAEQTAAENRLVHGRPKDERELQRARDDKARKSLEQHRIDKGDEP